MSISGNMAIVTAQVKIIESAQNEIKALAAKLEQQAPFKVGDKLPCNGFSHNGKMLLVDTLYVSDKRGSNARYTGAEPVCFKAEGCVYKADNTLGVYRGEHTVKISDLINNGKG